MLEKERSLLEMSEMRSLAYHRAWAAIKVYIYFTLLLLLLLLLLLSFIRIAHTTTDVQIYMFYYNL